MRARRAELLVGATGAAFGASVVGLLGTGDPLTELAAAVLGGSLGATHRHPRAAWLVATAALLGTAPDGSLPFAAYGLVLTHAVCAGRREQGWPSLVALAALVGGSEVGVLVDGGPAVLFLFVPAAAWGAGRALGDREHVFAKLTESARELDEEREAHARLSVRYERARIAAELHDIVAHALTVMVVQATAGQRIAAVDPDLTAETFASIASAAQQAEQDVGRLVALLAAEDAPGPTPDLRLIEELVTRAADSGLHVTLRLEGDREDLPRDLGKLAYRIVQEGLTNALRYASGAPVAVIVRGDTSELVITVTNGSGAGKTDLADSGTGHGLLGIRERVGARGGTLEAGRTPNGGWRLVAQLPKHIATTK